MRLVSHEHLTGVTGEMPVSPGQHRRRWRHIVLVITLILVVIAATAGGAYLLLRPRVQPLALPAVPSNLSAADLGLAGWQMYQRPLPPDPLANPTLPATPQVNPALAALEDAAGQALIRQGALDRGMAYLRAAVLAAPDNLRFANDYRLALRAHGRYSDEEAFFTWQVQTLKTPDAHLNLALAYVDAMLSCPPPPDGLVCQAQLSYRSISELNTVLAVQPDNIIARYARGLNHLYWPVLMGHLPKAQIDLEYAVALTRPLRALGIGSAFIPQAYAALGDVFAKDGQVQAGRNVWLNGERVAPNAPILQSRLAIPTDQLVNEETGPLRGLGIPVNTDISIFWSNGR
jgi:tetratricopeptide (TPR) repeat protein